MNTKENEKLVNPCDCCKTRNLSYCCGAPIIHNDTCSECLEHCDSVCDHCKESTNFKK